MSYLDKVKGGGGGGDFKPFPSPAENPQDVTDLIEWYEGNKQHAQAVRLRLWNGLPQREAHRELVEKWLASKCARDNPPPAVPRWVKRGEPIEESEERRMDRAMWKLSRGMVTQAIVNGWPERWRVVGRTQGYLNKDGTLRTFTKPTPAQDEAA